MFLFIYLEMILRIQNLNFDWSYIEAMVTPTALWFHKNKFFFSLQLCHINFCNIWHILKMCSLMTGLEMKRKIFSSRVTNISSNHSTCFWLREEIILRLVLRLLIHLLWHGLRGYSPLFVWSSIQRKNQKIFLNILWECLWFKDNLPNWERISPITYNFVWVI